MEEVVAFRPITPQEAKPPGSWILAPGSLLITDLLITDYFSQKVQRCLSHHLFECRSIGREEQIFHL